jgi:nucleoside-diphosphate-sugar epimerase
VTAGGGGRGRRALVTGATGLVGWHIIEQLLAEGWSVRALVRDIGRAGVLGRMGVELRHGDVLEPRGFAVAARGCDVVFHTAALILPQGGWPEFEAVNIAGTRNAIDAASAASARLLHVSSVAVYGPGARYYPGTKTDESAVLQPLSESDFYGRSKRESERMVLEAHEAGRIWGTSVRPSVIYGRRDRHFVPRLGRLLERGVVPLIGGGESTLSVVHAANVADGAIRAAAHDGAGGRAFNLAHDFDVTVADFMRLGALGLGATVRFVPIPVWLARAGLAGARTISSVLHGGRFRMVTRSSAIDFVTRDNPFSSELARTELGWAPKVHPEEGVPDAFRWWSVHR